VGVPGKMNQSCRPEEDRKREAHRAVRMLFAAGLLLTAAVAPAARRAQQARQPQDAQPAQQAAQQQARQPSKSGNTSYPLTNSVSVQLGKKWQPVSRKEVPPPDAIAAYAPPFHFSHMLLFSNAGKHAILQIATSNNPLIGRDSYWLDAQLHTPSGSGTSMADFLFFLFLPPSRACMKNAIDTHTAASRVPQNGNVSAGDMQVFYSCEFSPTLYDFYASQVSAGLDFRYGTTGGRAFGVYSDFYVAPMQRDEINGMTFFVFEALAGQGITADETAYFHLPYDLQGAQPDFLWAIGAPSPFPFVSDPSRADNSLVNVGYAGFAPAARGDFIRLLHKFHTQ
jgi:hypothetical protein